MQSTIDNHNSSAVPETTMVSVLSHDSKNGAGMLVAIALLSILILIVCTTVAICYCRKNDCFGQKAGTTSTNELMLNGGSEGHNSTNQAESRCLHQSLPTTPPPSVPPNLLDNDLIHHADFDSSHEARYFALIKIPEQPHMIRLPNNPEQQSSIDLSQAPS